MAGERLLRHHTPHAHLHWHGTTRDHLVSQISMTNDAAPLVGPAPTAQTTGPRSGLWTRPLSAR